MRRILGSLLLASLALTSLGFEWEGRLSRLRRELESPDPAQRREVVQLLSSYPGPEVRDALLGALEDEDAGVRAQAADAVGRVRLREAVPRLLDWLDDPDADVRAAAARSLGQIGEASAVPSLVRVLGDTHTEVRRAGIGALASIGGDEVVVPILGRLDDVDAHVRVEAATLLGHIGDERAVVPLVGRARDDDPDVRSAVYAALGDLGDERSLPALVQGLRDEAPEPQLAAIAALGRLGVPEAVRPLTAAMVSTDTRIPRAVTAALGQVPGDEARGALIDALAETGTRVMAAQTLVERAERTSRAGDPEAQAIVRALATALDSAHDPAHATRIALTLSDVAAFERIEPAAPALLRAMRDGRGDVGPVLRALGSTASPDVVVPLLERLSAEPTAERLAVLEGLRRYFNRTEPDGRAADPLLAILGNVTDAERSPVIELLGRVQAARALPTLRSLLTHRDPALRLAAIRAIGAIGDPEGAPALLALFDDRDARLRFEAARAVGAAASSDVVSTLLSRVVAREPTDRHALLTALAGALPRLSEAGEISPELRARGIGALISLSASDDDALAARALDVIAAWAPHEAAVPLVRLLENRGPARNLAAAQALGALDHPRAREALREMLEAPSVTLSPQAAPVLGDHGGPEEAALLLERGPELAWPASAAAAFALARLARRGALTLEGAGPGLCALGTSHDPFVRANVAVALASLAAPPCPSGAHPLSWLERSHAAVVRVAAARWARAAADAEHLTPASVEEALADCARDPLAPEVARVCAHPALTEETADADVFAYTPDGSELLVSRLVALRFSDGSVWVLRTDMNGHLRLRSAPAGSLTLEDPAATPLEP